jgi:hypothetical protein
VVEEKDCDVNIIPLETTVFIEIINTLLELCAKERASSFCLEENFARDMRLRVKFYYSSGYYERGLACKFWL